MTLRRDSEAWQKLRLDKRSAATALLVILAGMAALLAVIGLLLGPSRATDRTNSLYWALMLPFAWWASALGAYEPWATRTLRSAAAIAALTSLICLIVAANIQQDRTPWIIAALIATPCAMAGALLYSRSLLARIK